MDPDYINFTQESWGPFSSSKTKHHFLSMPYEANQSCNGCRTLLKFTVWTANAVAETSFFALVIHRLPLACLPSFVNYISHKDQLTDLAKCTACQLRELSFSWAFIICIQNLALQCPHHYQQSPLFQHAKAEIGLSDIRQLFPCCLKLLSPVSLRTLWLFPSFLAWTSSYLVYTLSKKSYAFSCQWDLVHWDWINKQLCS